MDINLSDAIWDCKAPLSSTEKLVLLCLARYCNKDRQCWPSVVRIARECGLSRPGVRYALCDMQATGAITFNVCRGGCRKTHTFILHIEWLKSATARTPIVRARPRKGRKEPKPWIENRKPGCQLTGNPVATQPETRLLQVETGLPRIVQKAFIESFTNR